MNVFEWLEKVAYSETVEIMDTPSIVYRSKFDNGYIGHVGRESVLEFLANLEITEELQTRGNPEKLHAVSVGFSPKHQKWYGWSHRAIYGFGIGSKIEKGDCAYTADNPEEMIADYANFFADISAECAEQHRQQCQILPDRSGIRILHAPLKIPMLESIDQLPEAIDGEIDLPAVDIMGDGVQILKCGRGEWTAKTLDDAKQMATDFAENVS